MSSERACFWCNHDEPSIVHHNEDGHAFVPTATEALKYLAAIIFSREEQVRFMEGLQEIARRADDRIAFLEKQRDELQESNSQYSLRRQEAENLLGKAAQAIPEVSGPVHERIRILRHTLGAADTLLRIRDEARLMYIVKKHMPEIVDHTTRWPSTAHIETIIENVIREVISGNPI